MKRTATEFIPSKAIVDAPMPTITCTEYAIGYVKCISKGENTVWVSDKGRFYVLEDEFFFEIERRNNGTWRIKL